MAAAKNPAKPVDKGPAIMIMIGLKPHGKDVDDKPTSRAPAAPSRPSNRGKVPSFGGKTRRSFVGS